MQPSRSILYHTNTEYISSGYLVPQQFFYVAILVFFWTFAVL